MPLIFLFFIFLNFYFLIKIIVLFIINIFKILENLRFLGIIFSKISKKYTFFKNKYKSLYITYIKVTLGNKNIS